MYQVSSTILKSLVWREQGLNPGLLDHWRTLYPLQYKANTRCYRNYKKFSVIIYIFKMILSHQLELEASNIQEKKIRLINKLRELIDK